MEALLQEFTFPRLTVHQTLYDSLGDVSKARRELEKRAYETFLNRIWNGEDCAPGPFYENTFSSISEPGFQRRVRDTTLDYEVCYRGNLMLSLCLPKLLL